MNQYRFGASRGGLAVAFFDGERSPTPTESVRVLQKEFHHDIAVVTIYGENAESRKYRTGAPVEIQYGAPSNVEHFFGYVNHIEPVFEQERVSRNLRKTKVVCVGASWALKAPLQKAYTGRTATSIIREIAEANKFTTDVEESDVVWQQLASPGKTQWEFLVSLAKQIGFTLYCNQTEVRCFDQFAHLRSGKGALPFYAGQEVGSPTLVTVKEFRPISGETTPVGGEKAKRIAYGVDPRRASVVKVTDDMSTTVTLGREASAPIFEKFEQDLVVTDPQQAAQRLGAVTKANRFHLQATATIIGDTRVTQGSIIAILGAGDRNSGYWYVQEVEHKADQQAYVMDVCLGRDSYGQTTVLTPSGTRVLRERYNPFDSRVAIPPPTVFVNGQWRSAYAAKRQAV